MTEPTVSPDPSKRARIRRLALDAMGWGNWCGSLPVLFVTAFNDSGAAPPAWFPSAFMTPALGLILINLVLFPLTFVILAVIAPAAVALEQNARYDGRLLRAVDRGRDALRAWSALASLGTAYLFAYMALAIAVAK